MTVLWGCAFENFVSSGSGERNVADEYLKRRGWKESAGARAYIRAQLTVTHPTTLASARTPSQHHRSKIRRPVAVRGLAAAAQTNLAQQRLKRWPSACVKLCERWPSACVKLCEADHMDSSDSSE